MRILTTSQLDGWGPFVIGEIIISRGQHPLLFLKEEKLMRNSVNACGGGKGNIFF